MQIIDRILRQTKPVNKYNVLEFITHERYQGTLAKTGHNFYVINGKIPGIKEFWNTKFGPIPPNYIYLPPVDGDNTLNKILNSLPQHITFDCIISHQKFGQYQIAKPLSEHLGIPLISLEHTLPHPQWPQQRVKDCWDMKGDFNLFITDFNKRAWGWNEGDVISHGLDTELFHPSNKKRENTILTVNNDFINRDWCLGYGIYQRAVQNLPVRCVGDTPGLSQAPNCVEELVEIYQTSSIFLNTAIHSPIPSVLIEAAACGCAIVSLNTCAVPSYITHGVNGFLANDEEELKIYLLQLLNDEKLRHKLGKAARESIVEKCSIKRFCSEWNTIFDKAFKKEN